MQLSEKSIVRKYLPAILIGVMQWFLSGLLKLDTCFFTYESVTEHMIIVKIVFLIAIIFWWCFVLNIYRKIKERDAIYVRALRFFLVYFLFILILFVVLWPGTWSWDDLWTLNQISTYSSFTPWQNIITGIYLDLLLQIIPFPWGIILIQNIIIAICVSCIIVKLEKYYKLVFSNNKIIDMIIKLIPFFLPPVLMYQLSGYRMGMYVHLEALLLVLLLTGYKDKEWRWNQSLLICFLTVIVSIWRTESFIYILLAIGTYCVIRMQLYKKAMCICLILIGFFSLNQWQNAQLGDDNYKIISIMGPCVELVRVADPISDADELANIDKITSIDIISDNPYLDGEELYWHTDCVRNMNDNPYDDYTVEDYNLYFKSFLSLSVKYPMIVLKERWNTFWNSAVVSDVTTTNINRSATLFDDNVTNNALTSVSSYDCFSSKPILYKLRKATIFLFGGFDINGSPMITRKLVWNSIIPILIIVYACIHSLTQKRWYWVLICSAVISRLAIVFLTQPGSWFMYLLSFYYLGMFYGIYNFMEQLRQVKKNNGKRCR